MWQLAWRNIWRNKRRTVITASSVLFAVFFAILLRGFETGAWQELINSVLHSYTGYIQIHAKGFWDNRTFDYLMYENDTMIQHYELQNNKVKQFIPRFESFALASNAQKSKGVIVIGISTEAEKTFSLLQDRIIKGSYLNDSDRAILVSQRLATFLNIAPGDFLVLIGKGYQGVSASALFRVKGIVQLASPEFDNQLIFMPIALAQDFYSAPDLITSWIVDLYNPKNMDKVVRSLSKNLPSNKYEVMSWHDMLVEMYQQYKSDEIAVFIILVILYVIVGSGIFGTVMMMLSERRYEMGIMIALGMKRSQLGYIVSLEMIFICLLGIIMGVAIGVPVIYWFHLHPVAFNGEIVEVFKALGMNPILPAAWDADYIIEQSLNILIVCGIVLVYPFCILYKFNLVNALKR
jgi:ABC-type lipoprotein release transport system permease subunit